MKNVVVCVSGINSEQRSEIHKLVGFMGGLWLKELTESTTHLITNTTQSPKYEVSDFFCNSDRNALSTVQNMKNFETEDNVSVWNLY